MMKNQNLYELFRHFEGQPVEIFTEDGKVHCGIDVNAFDAGVRIIDRCSRPQFIPYAHITDVVEPQMRLRKCCKHECKCEQDEDFDDFDNDEECEEREENEFRRRSRR